MKTLLTRINNMIRENRYYWFDIYTAAILLYDVFSGHTTLMTVILAFVFGMSFQSRLSRGDMRFSK